MQVIVDTARATSLRAKAHVDSLRRLMDSVQRLVKSSDSQKVDASRARLVELRPQLENDSSIYDSELRRANQYEVEIQKKYSIPAACLVFIFVGAPLGILLRRGNCGVSAAIA